MMSQVDARLTGRFARSYANAAFGYARAASAAYAAFTDQALDFWGQAARAAEIPEEHTAPRLQLVTGPRPYRSAVNSPAAPAPPMPDFLRLSNAWAASPMFAPVRAWWGMFPLEGNPASWPMAHAMMTAGVPRSVALPTAEANLAVMEVAEVAQETLDRTFSAYRSDSGFAVSQIVSPKTWLSALFMAPFAVPFKMPWI